jgi:hypothetical protein
MRYLPAGQTATATDAPTQTPVTPSAPPLPAVASNSPPSLAGGLDSIVDQIGEGAGRLIGPVFREHVYPIIQRDKELQREIGAAVGRSIAQRLVVPAWIVALGIATIAGVMVYKASK